MLAVGIFGAKDELEGLLAYDGILHGGGFYLFGVQLLACCCMAVWASSCTFFLIWVGGHLVMNTLVVGAQGDPSLCGSWLG